MVLTMYVMMKKDKNMDMIFPFLNFALVFRCYKLELSFLMRWIGIGCRECFAVCRMCSIGLRKICVLIALVLFVSICLTILLIIWLLEILFLLHAIQDLTAANLLSIHTCDCNKSYKFLQENTTFINEAHEVYKLQSSFENGYSLYSEFEARVHLSGYVTERHEEINISIHEDVTIQCAFTISPYEKYSPPFPLIWKYKGKTITSSHKHIIVIKTRIRRKSIDIAMTYLVFSTLTIFATEEEDFGEYSCIARVVNICSNGLLSNVCDYVDVKSTVMKRYFIKQQEKLPVKIIPVSVGNSVFITWCKVDIDRVHSVNPDFSLYHTVGGKFIDFNRAENDESCSVLSWFLHDWSYFFGWISVQPPNKYRGVYVSRYLNGDLQYTLHTCANEDIYGLHKMILLREVFNTTSKSNILLEVEHPQDILIVPEKPYTRGNMSGGLQSDVYGSYIPSKNDVIVYYLRIVLEYVIISIYVYILTMEIFRYEIWCMLHAIQNYILEEPKYKRIKSQTYDVAILCSEDDKGDWTNNILEKLEDLYKMSVFFVH